MPSMWTRRRILQTVGAGLVIPIAGCVTNADSGATSPTTQSPTIVSNPYDFSLDATMQQQPTASTPAKFRVSLTNEGSQPVELGYGVELMFSLLGSPSGEEEPIDSPAEEQFIFVPSDDPLAEVTNPDSNCWRYGAGRERITPVPRPAIIEWRSVDPGGSVSSSFHLFSKATNDTCYPPGEYLFRDGVMVDREAQENIMSLTIGISVDESSSFALEAHPPRPPS